MAVGVAGLAFRGRAEHGGDVVVAFDVGLLREIEIAAVGLAFAGERGLQILRGLGVLSGWPWESPLPWKDRVTVAPHGRKLPRRTRMSID